jgi:hypothetical protein
MGLDDREYRQNDSWKKRTNIPPISALKYNESKGEMEFDKDQVVKPAKNRLRDSEIKIRKIHYKQNGREMDEDIHAFHQASKERQRREGFRANTEPENKSSFRFLPWILALLIILAISKAIHKNSTNEPSNNTQLPAVSTSIAPPPTVEILPPAPVPMPMTSVLFSSYDPSKATCPLTIMRTEENYYVKLCDVNNRGQTVAKFFIRAGEEFKTTVPVGIYTLKYASGNQWYGEGELFGALGQYGKSDRLEFTVEAIYDGVRSNGNIVSLYKSVGGNLQTSDVNRATIQSDSES